MVFLGNFLYHNSNNWKLIPPDPVQYSEPQETKVKPKLCAADTMEPLTKLIVGIGNIDRKFNVLITDLVTLNNFRHKLN